MSSTYGGSQQATFPSISPKRFAEHGLHFAFLKPDWNPDMPRKPGQNGLGFFGVQPSETNETHVFRWKAAAAWHYLGLYRFSHQENLSVTDWQLQDDIVRTL
jgi:hypothetical protein